LEAGEVRATVTIEDVVRVAEDLLGVAVRPLQGEIDDDARLALTGRKLAGERDHLFMNRLLRLAEQRDELADSTLVLVDLAARLATLVLEVDDEPRVQEGGLTQPIREDVEAVLGVAEDLVGGLEGDLGSRAIARAEGGERRLGNAAPVLLEPHLAVTVDLEPK